MERNSLLRHHARACRGHPRVSLQLSAKDVDGRDKPGHDLDKWFNMTGAHYFPAARADSRDGDLPNIGRNFTMYFHGNVTSKRKRCRLVVQGLTALHRVLA
jgi:hypothetical protein